jgi:hypothetical protein
MVSRLFLLALLLAPWPVPAAQRIVLTAEQVLLPVGMGEGLALTLRWDGGDAPPQLAIELARLEAAELGYRFAQVRWQCALESDDAGMHCRGPARARGLREGRLDLSLAEDALQARLARSGAQAEARYVYAQARLQLQARALPLDWIRPLTDWLWAEASLQSGSLTGRLELDLSDPDALPFGGRIELAGLDLDTPDGRIAAAGLGLALDLSGRVAESDWRLALQGPLRGGEILLGPVYAALPERGATLDLALRSAAGGRLALERFAFADAGVIALQASGLIDAEAEDVLPQLDLRAELPDLEAAHARYGETALATLGLSGLTVSGRAAVSLARGEGRWQRIAATDLALDARDGGGRFAVNGLRGGLVWNAGSEVQAQRLSWESAELYRIALGPSQFDLHSANAGLGLAAPTSIPALGGRIALDRLHWQPDADGSGPSLDLGLGLQDLDLNALARAFDWPPFVGRISGSLPQAYYARGTLTLDGGLRMDLFGGRIDIGQLILERPFGVAPTLSADVRFGNIDLQPLTTVFGFGEISGRLEGHIRGLRLVDWSPVAFDAELRTAKDAPGPRRISQRAVRDLSSVGGGSFAGGLQASVLRAFETFGYSRIGLSCRLERNVCQMGGIDSSGQGYTIVEGSGLPRISVVGFQRRVDWPVLIDRLKATAQGQRPTFD